MESRSNESARLEACAVDSEVVELAYAKGPTKSRRGRRAVVVLAVTVPGLLIGFVALNEAMTRRCGPVTPEAACRANLRGIGMALYVYAVDEPDHMFPDDVQRVIDAMSATPRQFICPSAAAGRQHYYYVPGLSAESDPSAVVMYEDPRNHRGEGGNVLFVDSHVEYVRFPNYQAIVDAHRASAQPVLGLP